MVGARPLTPPRLFPLSLRPGPAGIGRSLREKARKVGPLQNPELRLQLLDHGILFDRDRICGRVQGRFSALRRQLNQLGRSDRDLGRRQTHELRDVSPRNFDRLPGLNQQRSRSRKLCFRPGRVRAGSQLRVHQRVDRPCNHFGSIHSGLSRSNCLLCRDQSDVGVRSRRGDVELSSL